MKTERTSALESWLVEAQGRCIVSVQGGFYRSVAGEFVEGDPPLSLWVKLEGMTRIRLFVKGNAEEIGLDEEIPKGCDMGSAGKIIIKDITTTDPFLLCLKSPLRHAALIREPGTDEPFGIKLRFDSQAEVLILNWGDDLFVSDQPPPDATEEEFVLYPVGNK